MIQAPAIKHGLLKKLVSVLFHLPIFATLLTRVNLQDKVKDLTTENIVAIVNENALIIVIISYIYVVIKAVYHSFREKSVKNEVWSNWFDEFREAGAKTGYFDMKNIDGKSKEIEVLTSIAVGDFKGGFYKCTKTRCKIC